LILSTEESIQRLKTEILSQDWRLSDQRVETLGAAFSCLKKRFRNRKAAYSILVMANNVLVFVQRHGSRRVPGAIDFLKEAMAHIVNLYEDPVFDVARDKKIFKAVYKRFNSLKTKVTDQQPAKQKTPPPPETESPVNVTLHELKQQKPDNLPLNDPSLEQQWQQVLTAIESKDGSSVETLVKELKDSLKKAEDVGATIRQLLVELLSGKQADLSSVESFVRQTILAKEAPPQGISSEFGEKSDSPPSLPKRQQPETKAKPCPETTIITFAIGNKQLAVDQSCIACHQTVNAQQRETYIKNNTVPLKDFSRFMQRLSKRFAGNLGTLKDSKLKKLSLPVITPRGFGLPERPDDGASTLLALTNGHWNGILLCSDIALEPKTMIKIKRMRNGDIAGIGYTDNEEQFFLLNVTDLLKREGYLVLV